jgi:hypothetical protein
LVSNTVTHLFKKNVWFLRTRESPAEAALLQFRRIRPSRAAVQQYQQRAVPQYLVHHDLRGGAASFGSAPCAFVLVPPTKFVRFQVGDRSGEGEQGEARRMQIKNLALDPEVADLVTTAFDKSWQFVRTDPELAHNDMDEMRAHLSRHLARLARNGERDLWRLANGAIGQLRRERSAA